MGGKTTVKQDNTIDPWSRAQYESASGAVRNTLNQNPFQPYAGEMVAGLNPMETEAADYFRSNMGAGGGLIGSAAEMAQAVGGYSPMMLETDRDHYMNPYIDDVVNTSLGDLERSRMMAINEGQASAAQAGAFGGSRHGVADSLTNEAALRTAASTSANLRHAGFESASDRAMTAGLANQGADLSGAGLRLQAGGLLGQLGQAESDMVGRDAFALAAFGENARNVDQATLDRAYQEFLREQEDPYRRAQVHMGLLGNVPIIQDRTETTKSSPGLLGAVGSAVGMGGMLFGGGGPLGGLFGSAAGAAAPAASSINFDLLNAGRSLGAR